MQYNTAYVQPYEALLPHLSVLCCLVWRFYSTIHCATMPSLFSGTSLHILLNLVVMYIAPHHAVTGPLTRHQSWQSRRFRPTSFLQTSFLTAQFAVQLGCRQILAKLRRCTIALRTGIHERFLAVSLSAEGIRQFQVYIRTTRHRLQPRLWFPAFLTQVTGLKRFRGVIDSIVEKHRYSRPKSILLRSYYHGFFFIVVV